MKRKDAVGQRAVYLVSKPNFQRDVRAVRHSSNIPENGFASEIDLGSWLEKHVYGTAKGNDIEEAIELAIARIVSKPEYGLSPGWQHSIKRFMYLNDPDNMQLPVGLESRLVFDELTEQPTIHVIVTGDITEQDYKDGWKSIKEWRKRLNLNELPKQRRADPIKLRRGKYAYDLWLSGSSYSDVAKELEKDFSGTVYIADDAKTIIHNFIKQSGT